MASGTVKDFSKAWWSEVYNRIIGAVVFLDDASAECLHWDDGLANLLSGGAVEVKELSPFEFCRKKDKKAVFITQATWTQVQTICDIIKRSDLTNVIVISCVSLDVLYLEVSTDNDASEKVAAGKGIDEGYKLLENALKKSFDGKQCSIEIVPAPIMTVSLTNVVFLTPPYRHVYPKCKNQIIIDPNVTDLYNMLVNERNDARRLAGSLNSMLDSMNLKEDIYYMGGYSTILAGILENSPVCLARRKNCSHPASLILVDRTLDLSGVTSHSSESILDKMMELLPRFPGHSTEVAVDMSPLCKATNNVDHNTDFSELSPGCLYHATDEGCIQTFDYMINKSQKEVMFDLYNKLCKLDVQKSPSPKKAKMLMKVTPQSIEKILTAAKGNYPVIINHLGVLQQACAIVQALKSPQRSQLDLLMSLEKQFLENLATSRDSTTVLQQVCHLIETRNGRDLPVDRLMALLVHIYSLKGKEIQFPKAHEDTLEKVMGAALYQDLKSSMDPLATDELGSKERCEKIAKDAILMLKDIANMRANMTKYNILLKPCETGVGYEYKGVLQQLVEDLVDSERPEMPDLRHKNESLVLKTKDLLRTGLSMLTQKKTRTAKTAKHPLDNPTIIIFVIGGITAEECKRLHRTVITSGVDNTVLIGSTKMVNPIEAMHDVLPFKPSM